jgi:LysM repeat protein
MIVLLFGCAKPHPEPAPQREPPPIDQPPPPPERKAEKMHTPTADEKDAAQQRAKRAAEMLQEGEVDTTRIELQRSLKLDPDNVIASTLQRQLDEDPTVILGKDHFPYTVVSGDTLSRIADRFLGDKYMFYALARYNGITKPRRLPAGQVIQVLGKAPKEQRKPAPDLPRKPDLQVPAAAPDDTAIAKLYDLALQRCKSAEPARAAGRVTEALDQLDRGHQAYREAVKLGGQGSELLVRRDSARRCLADGYYRDGVKALYDQDVELAIPLLARVLEVEPDNRPARENYAKAVYLKEKWGKMAKR